MDESSARCGAGLDCQFREVERPRDWWERVRTEFCSCLTSVRNCYNSVRSCGEGGGVVVAATVGAATSALLSASSANSSRLVVALVEASTMRTFKGKHCRNSSRKNVLSVTPARSQSSCCIRRSN